MTSGPLGTLLDYVTDKVMTPIPIRLQVDGHVIDGWLVDHDAILEDFGQANVLPGAAFKYVETTDEPVSDASSDAITVRYPSIDGARLSCKHLRVNLTFVQWWSIPPSEPEL